jgi:phage tail-like protein
MSFRIGPYLLTYKVSNESPFVPDNVQDESYEEIQAQVVSDERADSARKHFQQVPRSPGQETSSLYMSFLPDIYQENDFLRRFLLIFEEIWEPLERRQDHIYMYFHPLTCPVVFLPWLAKWLGFPLDPHWPEMRRRRLLAQAMDLYRWRGTLYGLVRMIEVCTGVTPEITENNQEPFVFHIVLPISKDNMDRAFIEELIHTHKPAHAGFTLEIRG